MAGSRQDGVTGLGDASDLVDEDDDDDDVTNYRLGYETGWVVTHPAGRVRARCC